MIVDVKRRLVCVALAALATGAGSPTAVAAEAETPRAVLKRVTPEYPEMARKVHAAGKVKLSVLVTPEGKVKRVDILGGHPILAVAASDAAKLWVFAAASRESTEPLIFDFSAPE